MHLKNQVILFFSVTTLFAPSAFSAKLKNNLSQYCSAVAAGEFEQEADPRVLKRAGLILGQVESTFVEGHLSGNSFVNFLLRETSGRMREISTFNRDLSFPSASTGAAQQVQDELDAIMKQIEVISDIQSNRGGFSLRSEGSKSESSAKEISRHLNNLSKLIPEIYSLERVIESSLRGLKSKSKVLQLEIDYVNYLITHLGELRPDGPTASAVHQEISMARAKLIDASNDLNSLQNVLQAVIGDLEGRSKTHQDLESLLRKVIQIMIPQLISKNASLQKVIALSVGENILSNVNASKYQRPWCVGCEPLPGEKMRNKGGIQFTIEESFADGFVSARDDLKNFVRLKLSDLAFSKTGLIHADFSIGEKVYADKVSDQQPAEIVGIFNDGTLLLKDHRSIFHKVSAGSAYHNQGALLGWSVGQTCFHEGNEGVIRGINNETRRFAIEYVNETHNLILNVTADALNVSFTKRPWCVGCDPVAGDILRDRSGNTYTVLEKPKDGMTVVLSGNTRIQLPTDELAFSDPSLVVNGMSVKKYVGVDGSRAEVVGFFKNGDYLVQMHHPKTGAEIHRNLVRVSPKDVYVFQGTIEGRQLGQNVYYQGEPVILRGYHPGKKKFMVQTNLGRERIFIFDLTEADFTDELKTRAWCVGCNPELNDLVMTLDGSTFNVREVLKSGRVIISNKDVVQEKSIAEIAFAKPQLSIGESFVGENVLTSSGSLAQVAGIFKNGDLLLRHFQGTNLTNSFSRVPHQRVYLLKGALGDLKVGDSVIYRNRQAVIQGSNRLSGTYAIKWAKSHAGRVEEPAYIAGILRTKLKAGPIPGWSLQRGFYFGDAVADVAQSDGMVYQANDDGTVTVDTNSSILKIKADQLVIANPGASDNGVKTGDFVIAVGGHHKVLGFYRNHDLLLDRYSWDSLRTGQRLRVPKEEIYLQTGGPDVAFNATFRLHQEAFRTQGLAAGASKDFRDVSVMGYNPWTQKYVVVCRDIPVAVPGLIFGLSSQDLK